MPFSPALNPTPSLLLHLYSRAGPPTPHPPAPRLWQPVGPLERRKESRVPELGEGSFSPCVPGKAGGQRARCRPWSSSDARAATATSPSVTSQTVPIPSVSAVSWGLAGRPRARPHGQDPKLVDSGLTGEGGSAWPHFLGQPWRLCFQLSFLVLTRRPRGMAEGHHTGVHSTGSGPPEVGVEGFFSVPS